MAPVEKAITELEYSVSISEAGISLKNNFRILLGPYSEISADLPIASEFPGLGRFDFLGGMILFSICLAKLILYLYIHEQEVISSVDRLQVPGTGS
ncbi:hypothetical protein LPTSP1_15070 [Leptospira johnsonii]|uniref:Uncharacterized protein n=1 Tax=Leptospira johnsonii TaxID=1917820 RepID=A0A2P2D1I4_9LEPT|nr:hypothetical protein LPTSP1_15070 [Leptospira johnsonii]